MHRPLVGFLIGQLIVVNFLIVFYISMKIGEMLGAN